MNKLICPKCGEKILVAVLTSNPPLFECECSDGCGFALRYWDRKDRYSEITQEELEKENV